MENIDKIKFSEKAVQYNINWLAEKNNHGLEDYSLSEMVRFLLIENENLKKQIKEIQNQLK